MERCAHSGPEANDGPCDLCAGGPAPLPADPALSFSERFGRTEWGIPQLPADIEVTFVTVQPGGRKWVSVMVAFAVGVAVVGGLVATMLMGNPAGGRRPITASGGTPRASQVAAATPAASTPKPAAKPKPGPALRDAFISGVTQTSGGFHAAYTITITAPGSKSTMSGEMDTAGQALAAKLKSTGGSASSASAADEYVIKDGVVYNRETGSAWRRAASAKHLPSDPFASADELKGLDYVGARTVNGKKLHLFRGTSAALIEDGALRNGMLGVAGLKSVRFDVLVTPDGVPVRITASAKIRFTRDGKTLAATMELDYRISKFGKPVDIKTPTVGAPQSG